MKIEMGSKKILYGWFNNSKTKIPHQAKIQIAESLSSGINLGQFHSSQDGVQDELGWWVVCE